ncbi:MAG: peptidase M29 [Burkholderiales bacterium]|nr:peptidase M29 [Burkholderiales bacterium]MDE2456712.1 peptidase M29 [Burkholderiales bacterium]
MFEQVFRLCGVAEGDACAVLSENQTRPELPQLAELALARIGARPFHLVLPGKPLAAPVPVRSTGASDAVGRLEPVVQALAASVFVADCTVEGLQHAVELPRILKGGARVLAISHEHPEILERCLPRAEDEAPVREAMRRLKAAREMHVTSRAGTDLRIALAGARVGGVWGFTSKPGTLSHWPAGLVLAFPAAGSVNGSLVLARGDVNLTFKRYLQDPVRLVIERDHAVRVEGESVDADLMRGYFESWGDPSAYAASHVGWGLNRGARWDAMTFYDKADFNGTELRAFAGNFLYSTGANEVAGRHTLGHFDLPLRGCTVALDGVPVVDNGRLV